MKLLALLLVTHAFAAEPVKIPAPMRACTKSEECEAVPLRCGCCQCGAVAKLNVTDYLQYAGKKGCVDEPCNCKPLRLKPACVKNVCQLVAAKAKPAKLQTKHEKKR